MSCRNGLITQGKHDGATDVGIWRDQITPAERLEGGICTRGFFTSGFGGTRMMTWQKKKTNKMGGDRKSWKTAVVYPWLCLESRFLGDPP